jgi:Na+/proline symporter
MTLAWGIVLALLGLIHWGPVLVAGLTITSITYGAMLGVFLLGTWNRRANETGALVGFVAGLVFTLGIARFTLLAWTWYVFVGTIVTFSVGMFASLANDSGTRSTRINCQAKPQNPRTTENLSPFPRKRNRHSASN